VDDNLYQAPKANLRLRQAAPPGAGENALRMLLLVVFGFYGAMHCLFVPIAFVMGASTRTFAVVVNTLLVATFSILAFLATKRRQATVARWSLLLFLAGFGGTALYRLGFVVDALDFVDVKNALMFGIPALLALAYGRMLARRS